MLMVCYIALNIVIVDADVFIETNMFNMLMMMAVIIGTNECFENNHSLCRDKWYDKSRHCSMTYALYSGYY